MDFYFPTFQSVNHLKKSQVHYNHYNIFHILERKRLLQAKRKEVHGAAEIAQVELETKKEPDKATLAYKMYHSLSLPTLPPRYHKLNLPSHWFVDVVHNQKKRRLHRKSHGLIPFRELAQLVAKNHKAADFDTLEWCRDVASKLAQHNKAMEDNFMKNHQRKAMADKNTASHAMPKQAEFNELIQANALARSTGQVTANQQALIQGQWHPYAKLNQQQTLHEGKSELNEGSLMNAECFVAARFNYDRVMLNSFPQFGSVRDRMFSHPHKFHLLSNPVSNKHLAAWIAACDRVTVSLPVIQFPSREPVSINKTLHLRESDKSNEDFPSNKKEAKQDVDLDLKNDEPKQPPNYIPFLHEMIEDPETNDLIHWLPCGKIFTIADRTSFVKQLLPQFQGAITGNNDNEKLDSFRLCLKLWNFEQIPCSSRIPNGGYKKEGFVQHGRGKASRHAHSVVDKSNKLPSWDIHQNAATCLAHNNPTLRIGASSIGQPEMLAAGNALTNILDPTPPVGYPIRLFPHQTALAYSYCPLPLQAQVGFEAYPENCQQAQRKRNEIMLRFYQSLQAASYEGQWATAGHTWPRK